MHYPGSRMGPKQGPEVMRESALHDRRRHRSCPLTPLRLRDLRGMELLAGPVAPVSK